MNSAEQQKNKNPYMLSLRVDIRSPSISWIFSVEAM